ncbi:MAG: alpha-amylase family glycosyl hydrolase [Cytophagaceae bacterium]
MKGEFSTPVSISQINLDPKNKVWNSPIVFDDQIIYFLLVDRFNNGKTSSTVRSNGAGFGESNNLRNFCGGTIRGITRKLDYISSLGCTAIWISPVFENNHSTYHGYAIQNFLRIDPRFGTLQQMKEMVKEAHNRGLSVYMDAVINHTGDNWYYKEGEHLKYNKGKKYQFGGWRDRYRPVPVELRSSELYYRCGQIINFDKYPETYHGDIYGLKTLLKDGSESASKLLSLMVQIYCYWIAETDIDGFRMDAVKHMDPEYVSRFTDAIKEYCKTIGKINFNIFAEIAAQDNVISSYFHNKGSLDAALDFPLHFSIQKTFHEKSSPEYFKTRLKDRPSLLFVNFLDNHDQLGQKPKRRFCNGLSLEQQKAGLAILFAIPGIPCIYYGTEQGLQGEGISDEFVRECLFDPDGSADLFDSSHPLFSEISRLCEIRKSYPGFGKGRLNVRTVSDNLVTKTESKICVFATNSDKGQFLLIFNPLNKKNIGFLLPDKKDGNKFILIYNNYIQNTATEYKVIAVEGIRTVTFELEPHQLIILKNSPE